MPTTSLKGSRLSLQQNYLWTQLHPVGLTTCVVQLEGQLDVEALRRALQQSIDQHEILRTVFYRLPGMEVPVQVVQNTYHVSFPSVDLEGLAEQEQSQWLIAYQRAEQEQGIDLEHGPTMRVQLVRLRCEQYMLILNISGLCADRTTFPLLVEELACCYEEERGVKRTENEEPLQYADIAAWQEELLLEEQAEDRKAHWKQISLEQRETLKLPFEDKKKEGEQQNAENRGSILQDKGLIVLNEESGGEKVKAQAELLGVSEQAYLLACWQIVLWRLTGEREVLVGLICNGRHYEELAVALGPYSRVVPFKTHFLRDDQRFEQVVRQVDASLQEAIRWQEYFIWDEVSQTFPRHLPVSYEYEHWTSRWQSAGISWHLQQVSDATEPFALKLQAIRLGEHLQLSLHYAEPQFAREHIQRLADCFIALLHHSLYAPQMTIGALPLLNEEQRQQQWQRFVGPLNTTSFQSLHRLFENWAERTPEVPAVVDGEQVLSYRQLNVQANRVARALRERGVGPNVPVGLCLSRGVLQLVGLLGILKAGGAYVPMEADHPASRLLTLLHEIETPLLLTEARIAEKLASWSGETMLLDDPFWQQGGVVDNLALTIEPEDLAYLLYTSGSTGEPKGVMIAHRSMSNYTQAISQRLRVQPGWRCATVSTLAADLGNTAIFSALANGGCVHLLSYETVTVAQEMQAVMERWQIDLLKIVPSHLAALLDGGAGVGILPHRALVLGGEKLTWELLKQVQQLGGACRVYNHYGPTEATVGVLVHEVEQDANDWEQATQLSRSVPLGQPLDNCSVYVVDEHGEVVPDGVVGELWITGAGLARGYWKREQQTQERFVFRSHPAQKLQRVQFYQTGDLVRITKTGQLEYRGRKDSQVKVRGYRVELTEIEHVLLELEGIRECVVLLREGEKGNSELVGYLACNEGLRGEEIKRQLREYLPEYMVPDKIVRMKTLPLTPNGKIDRQFLLQVSPEEEEEVSDRQREQARGPIEETLVEIWSDVLGVRRIGVHDNFFELGGHSLLATQVISRVRAIFKAELTIGSLFEEPTIEGLGKRIEQVLRGEQAGEMPPLVRVSREQALPLSFAQQRLWFLHQLEPEDASYNKSIILRLIGSLNVDILARSLGELIKRHEVLRTTFKVIDGQPAQIIHNSAFTSFPYVDLTSLDEEERERELQNIAHQDALRSFNLSHGPLLRVVFLRLTSNENSMLLTMHHIVSDAWSNLVCLRELSILYNNLIAGTVATLPELQIQYADYAAWQRQWLQGEILEKQIHYWTERLDNVPLLELPTDRPRLLVQTHRGAHFSRIFSARLCAELKTLSQQEGVTLFMTLVAAFQVLLARYSGQNDISVGTPIANRTQSEIEGLIGFFVNTLVLRTDLSGNPSFTEMLKRTRETALGAYAHQDVPFEKLVEVLQPERDMSHPPLFQVMVGLQQLQTESYTFQGLTFQGRAVESAATKFDITLAMAEQPDGLHCRVEYSTDLFDELTIGRMLEHFETLLSAIVAQPEESIQTLPLLSTREYEQVLHLWNTTQAAEALPEANWVQVFEMLADTQADAVAVQDEEQQVTYEVLNYRSNQLARVLQSYGAGPECLVGLCLDRTVRLIEAILAIAKAGAGLLPLDGSYPQERLRYMLADAQAPLLLTEQHLRDRLPVDEGQTRILLLEELCRDQEQVEMTDTAVVLHPEQVAYMIYTSGSTGQPKGVQVSVRGLINLSQEQRRLTQVGLGSRLLQFAALSFDASIFEMLMSLLNGATLLVASRERLLPGPDLLEILQREAITVITLPPSALSVLPAETLAHLNTILVAGEVCSAELVQRWAPGRRLFNAYGPTETTVCASVAECVVDGRTPPIGKPLVRMEVYVLDGLMQPVPIGVAGELYIGGIGVARGYKGKVEQTAERFVPHPWSQEEGARLYRTGDRVRWQVDGALVFMGRVDQQIKLRGYRIELGEIEAVLRGGPGVRESVVVVREEASGDRRLQAVVVEEEPGKVESSNLRKFLQERLPEYMVPSSIIVVSELPVTPSGKIDHRLLASRTFGEGMRSEEIGDEGAEPIEERTPIEEMLAGIWGEVLGVDQVHLEENFFELGGHSLLATQVISRIQTVLQVVLPLRTLFEATTVRGLAERVEEARRAAKGLQVPPLLLVSRTQPVPVSFAQQRLWFLAQLEPASPAYNIPTAVWLRGKLNIRVLRACLNELVWRHESLRTTFQHGEEYPIQIIASVRELLVPVVDLQGLVPEQCEELSLNMAMQEAGRPFDLTSGPLLRVMLVRVEEQRHLLVLTMHHIISDGVSSEIFVRELSALYTAFVAGQSSPLPALPIQYADFALWQRGWLRDEVLSQQMSYWTQQLAGAPALELPTDYPRPPVQRSRGARLSSVLSMELRDDLKALSQQEGVTLFMTLVAAFQVLLARSSGHEDISVGTPIANRTREEIEGLIGFFVNTLVLRSDLSGNPRFVDLLQQMRETALGAYAHQDVPFEKLVEALHPQRDLSRSPLFQVMFVLQSASRGVKELTGVDIRPLALEGTVSKFDLTLAVTETSQGLHCSLEYSTDLFAASTITRLLGHWQHLLEGIVQTPQASVAELPLLTASEYAQIVVEWNATQAPFPTELCLHQLVEQQVARTPHAVAVVCEEEQVTYGELNRRANQLARVLHMRGIGPETLVGICMERSIPQVIGMLAVLKAGGAYVPLDPQAPGAQLHQVLLETRATVLLIEEALQARFSEEAISLLCLENSRELLSQQSVANLPLYTTPLNLAYAIYTSGSTGRAKGVLISHANVVHSTLARLTRYQEPVRRYLLLSPFFFDSSVAGLYWTLCQGGQLVLPGKDLSQVLDRLPRLIVQQQISHLLCIPSLYGMLLAQAPEGYLQSLSTVIVAGERCSVEMVEQHRARVSQASLFNEYGPTEATVWSSVYQDQEPPDGQAPRTQVPIGKPISNTQLYLLQGRDTPAPVGVGAEVYIGGLGVARGYLAQADVTAEHFVPCPFGTQPGARMYRTGDRACYLPDGTIMYLGRLDQQVKLRGYRIELGAIEVALMRQEAIREAVVVVYDDRFGEPRLVAYVVADEAEGSKEKQVGEIRRLLHEQLPAYMVPASIVCLDALPLLPNGKVDRQALPAPEEIQGDIVEGNARARTPIEELIAGLYAQVLGRTQVGLQDNFFVIGGHSLLATQVVTRMQAVLSVEVPLRTLFEAPTVQGLAERVEQAIQVANGVQDPPLLPVTRAQALPLSFAQQRLWFMDQLEPGSSAYAMPSGVELAGQLEIWALDASLSELIQRHESLRTTFQGGEAYPIQVIAPAKAFSVPVVDLQGLAPEQREEQVRMVIRQEALRPFDLASGPLLRVSLIRVEPQRHCLLLTMHHIISDGVSHEIFLRELSLLYTSYVAGQPSPLLSLPVQYADFALWQREWLHDEVLSQQMNYWTRQLEGASALEMPTDYPRPPLQTHRGVVASRELSIELRDDLKALSQREGVTLFMTLMTAFQVLLARYSGQDDISVGTPIANRTRAEIEGLIGFFVNTLVLRSDLSSNPRFVDLLQQMRETALGAYAHQDVPFEKLVEALQPQRDLSRSPLFQVMFVLQNAPQRESNALAGVDIRPLALENTTSKFDLTLSVTETSRGLQCSLEYNTDLFAASTIMRLLGHWQRLLEGIVQVPEATIADLPLLTVSEYEQIVVDWNATQIPFPDDLCLHQLVEQQVARTPHAVAVMFEEQQVTYSELNLRANQLAHSLRKRGVGPEVIVGICMERSIAMVIGLVAILKAGGAYVPLDPTYPPERLTFMVQDAQVSLILTQQRMAKQWVERGVDIIRLDVDWETLQQESGQNPESQVQPEDLVYVIYTSGSTGAPKGVMISHRSLVNYLSWCTKAYAVEEGCGTSVHSPLGFDLTVTSLFSPLLVGRSVVMLAESPGVESLEQALCARSNFSLLKITPSHLKLLNQVLSTEELSRTVRALIIGGEALLAEDLAFWRTYAPAIRLINEYGPTETVVGCCVYEVPLDASIPGEVPIGRPIANISLYILDTQMKPVPVGVPGELYIAGNGLARGYLKRPDLTAERFIPNPFSVTPGTRLYRTGDMARYGVDGTIEFLGRKDHQVKIRGYRIELGEIETVLRACAGVSKSAVVVRADASGDRRLLAFVVGMPEVKLEHNALRRHLQEHLPEYMVPSALIELEQMPLTSSGKIDRRSLLEWQVEQAQTPEGAQEKQNPIQELIVGVWKEVLSRDVVDVDEDFFALGGHSLLATRVITRIRAVLQVELPLRSLFEAPRVRELAIRVEDALREKQGLQVPPLVPVSREQALPLSFAQQRLWFLHQLEPESTAYHMPTTLSLDGELDVQALAASLNALVRRHEILRTTFQLREEQPVQIIAPFTEQWIPVVDLQGLPVERREEHARISAYQEAEHPFDLAHGPLLRVKLVRMGEQHHLLLLTMHHIISDGGSNEIFVRELSTLYTAFVEGQPSPLPALPVQYADFALWQRGWLRDEVLSQQIAYWVEQLDTVSVLDLPIDHPRPLVQTFRGDTHSVMLPLVLTDRLKKLSQQEGATLFMTLLAAFQVLLMRYSGQRDISVGTPIANRTHLEIEELIGFFVNTLVLRTDLSGDLSFIALLERVRDITLSAYAHQYVPFEKLVEVLRPERDLSRHPLTAVMFGLQQASTPAAELSGLVIRNLNSKRPIAKFDLTFSIVDLPDGLFCGIEYSTDLFEAVTIHRLLCHWQCLLEAIVAEPGLPITSFSMLSEVERRYLLEEWNTVGGLDLPVGCWHEHFAQQSARNPDAIAVVAEEVTLSYGALEARANRLTHLLRLQGVGPEVLVGVYVGRSAELVVILLAIAKAGGGYVPLDPDYPQERLKFLIQDSGISLLIIEHQGQILPDGVSTPVLCIQQQQEELLRQSRETLETGVSPGNVAYVIYTSGSTGVPKGVIVEHKSLSNLVWTQAKALNISQESRILQFVALSFDVSVSEITMALATGARLHIRRKEYLLPGPELLQVLEEEAITVVMMPASVLGVLPAKKLSNLETLIIGGEVCSAEVVKQWAVDRQMLNAYGPTETTVCASIGLCLPDGNRPPIGRGLQNVELYILDEHMKLVPAGVPGELYVGGRGVARGYLGRGEQTAESFVPHPWSKQVGERLYRTGDRVRLREDDALEFLGRVDEQVKLRGYRIESGEIEAVLNRSAGVQESIVVVREEVEGDKRLVAFVIRVQEQELEIGQIREDLKKRIPAYMVPAAIIELQQWPQTPSGKVDRRRLMDMPIIQDSQEKRDQEGGEEGAAQMGMTPIQELIAGTWAEMLHVKKVERDDDFFELGGHSLVATRVATRIQAVLQIELPLRTLFEASTLRALAQRIERQLRETKGRQILPLLPIAREQATPVSFAQQRLWLLYQLEPESAAYNIPLTLDLDGMLNMYALDASLGELVRRHESLRTTFHVREGQLVQVIAPVRELQLPIVDLQGLAPEQHEERARILAQQEANLPFDLVSGPLLRVRLVRVGEQRHLLLLTMHHIISDGVSNEIFIRELSTLYSAFVAGQPSPLPALPIQYADFALWQNEWLRDEVLREQMEYWTRQLEGAPVLNLPTDRPRPPVKSSQGARLSRMLSVELCDGLKALSRREGVTLFMTLVAAFQVLLARYSGQDHISVGTPIANRTREEIEGLIGFFVNTLVLHSDLSGNPRFVEVLQQMRETALGAYAHQDVPFEKLVEALHPQRDLSRSPLFQVMFILQNVPQKSNGLAEVGVRPLALESASSKFDLTLAVTEMPQGLYCSLEYSTDLFDASTITRLLSHWQQLLEGIVHTPQASLSDLPLLTASEYEQIVVQWNATTTAPFVDMCLHQFFERQVEQTPDSIAVVFEEQQLTYRLLNDQANQLAYHLLGKGVGPEVLVGVCIERSLELVVTLLAVLKAGGVYVPLDPNYPQERLAFLLEDAEVSVLLTHDHLRDRFSLTALESVSIESLVYDTTCKRGNPVSFVRPDNLAYMIYTSGSTGRPKGVMIRHESSSALIQWASLHFSKDDLAGVLATTSICFDLSIFELFVPLSTGGTVVLTENLLHLSSLLAAGRVTLVNTVPSVLSEVLRLGSLPVSVQTVNLAGEPVPLSLVQQLSQLGTVQKIFNLYGPSEDTTYSTVALIGQSANQPILIGRPIARTQIYLLDKNLQPVPIGVPGELYIGGVGLARGYWKRPEQTAERFIAHPFIGREFVPGQSGERLYRTGDLARYRVDGNIEYLGRVDHQVKLRGFRIELGEIEATLMRHSAVREAVVRVREDTVGEMSLVAYVVRKGAQVLVVGELRRYLQEQLPAYMVPTFIVFLDALPLSANGKVDHKALPTPEEVQEEILGARSRARTPIEELIQGLWSDLLKRERIGVHENFFELGGHSLLATQLVSRIRQALPIDFSLLNVFERPTISELSRKIEEQLRGEPEYQEPALVRISREQTLPLSFAQQRLWFLHQSEPENAAYNIPLAVQLEGIVNEFALEWSLGEIIRRHESLRTTYRLQADEPAQVIALFQGFVLPIIDLKRLDERVGAQEVQRLVKEEMEQGFDLDRGPVVRSLLIRQSSEKRVLVLTMHHIASDGWSGGIFMKELAALYDGYIQGRPERLPELEIQYADYAYWQRQWLQGEVLEQKIRYWTQHLRGVAPLLLPVDRPRPPIASGRGANYSFALPHDLMHDLYKLSQKEGTTLFMTLLAAFQTLLYRYSDQTDIVVGTDIANRTRVETEALIGFFINLLVLRTNLGGAPAFRDLLAQIREMVLNAYLHQDVPFDVLVERIQPQHAMDRMPLVQILFVLQNLPEEQVQFSNVKIKSLTDKVTSAKFDIAVFVQEGPTGLQGSVVYSTDLFDESTIAMMMQRFEVLLRSIVSDPDTTIDVLELSSETERQLQEEQLKASRHRLRAKKSREIEL